MNEEGNEYKGLHSSLREQIKKDLEENLAKFKDPVILGELVFSLLRERENTNRLLKTLINRIEYLEAKLSEKETGTKDKPLLGETDQKIIDFIKKKGLVTANDVKKALNYKGTNGASMRLNKLYREGLLVKKQAGRKVYYALK